MTMPDTLQAAREDGRREQDQVVRACIGCGAGITGCFGFCIARDVVAGVRPRELCGRCVFRAERDMEWFEGLVNINSLLNVRPPKE
jgi:hypothetical protein